MTDSPERLVTDVMVSGDWNKSWFTVIPSGEAFVILRRFSNK